MRIEHGQGTTQYGPGIDIHLDRNEVAIAIDSWLLGQSVYVNGARTVLFNPDRSCRVYVDPSGYVIQDGEKISGRGPEDIKPPKYEDEIFKSWQKYNNYLARFTLYRNNPEVQEMSYSEFEDFLEEQYNAMTEIVNTL